MPVLASDWRDALGGTLDADVITAATARAAVVDATADLIEMLERWLYDGRIGPPCSDAVVNVRRAVDAALIGRRTLGS